MIANQEQKIMNLLSSRLDRDIQILHPDEDVVERLGINSFQVLDLLSAIETEFEIRIDDHRIREIKTVRDFLELVSRH